MEEGPTQLYKNSSKEVTCKTHPICKSIQGILFHVVVNIGVVINALHKEGVGHNTTKPLDICCFSVVISDIELLFNSSAIYY